MKINRKVVIELERITHMPCTSINDKIYYKFSHTNIFVDIYWNRITEILYMQCFNIQQTIGSVL